MKGPKRLGVSSAAMLLALCWMGSWTRAFPQVVQSGQTECFDEFGAPIDCSGTGQDGEFGKGRSKARRFTDNSDGTVTDKLTGLIWLKDPSCFGTASWSGALSAANTLRAGACSKLTDESEPGDWRLPNVREMASLLDYGRMDPALPPDHPFSRAKSGFYWTSTNKAGNANFGWYVYLSFGVVSIEMKTKRMLVWPVRDGP